MSTFSHLRIAPSLAVLLGLAFAALEPGLASAVSHTADSIEWLCDCMPHIGVVEVRLRKDVPNPSQVRSLRMTIGRMTMVLKGRPPEEAPIECIPGVRLKPGARMSLLAFFDDAL